MRSLADPRTTDSKLTDVGRLTTRQTTLTWASPRRPARWTGHLRIPGRQRAARHANSTRFRGHRTCPQEPVKLRDSAVGAGAARVAAPRTRGVARTADQTHHQLDVVPRPGRWRWPGSGPLASRHRGFFRWLQVGVKPGGRGGPGPAGSGPAGSAARSPNPVTGRAGPGTRDGPSVEGAYVPVNNRPISQCRSRPMSSMLSAPATMPATSAATFAPACAPLSVGTVSCSSTKRRSPTRSANVATGTSPPADTRLGSSNRSPLSGAA
jgi:hypothetical protein